MNIYERRHRGVTTEYDGDYQEHKILNRTLGLVGMAMAGAVVKLLTHEHRKQNPKERFDPLHQAPVIRTSAPYVLDGGIARRRPTR